MQKNLLPLLFVVFAVVVGIAVFVLFQDERQEDPLLDGGDVVADSGDEPEALPEPAGGDAGRERLDPAGDDLSEESEQMPSSFRQAMGVLKGRILEKDLTPVPGLKVELYGIAPIDFFIDGSSFLGDDPPQLDLRTAGTTTAEDGTFTITDVFPQAFYALCLDVGGARPTSRIVDHLPNTGETVDLGDIVLAPYAILTGVVLDDDDQPVQGARVRATQLPPVVFISGMQDYREECSFLVRFGSEQRVIDPPSVFNRFARLMPFPTTTTAEDGSFRLEGVPLGRLTVVVDRVDYVSNKKGPVSTAEGGERDVGTIVLDRGIELRGKIVDSFGEPASGIEVRVGPTCGIAEFILLQPPVFSGEGGNFTFHGAAPLSTFAAARRFPEDPWTIVGPFDPDLEPPTITLPPAFDLRIKIYGEEGALVKGARVKIRQEQETFMAFLPLHPPITPTGRMETPEEGIVDIMGLPPGSYDLLVLAPGYGVAKETVTVKAEPLQKDIVLELACLTTVRVISKKKKRPVEWAEVFVFKEEEEFFTNPTKVGRCRTNAAGEAVFKSLAPGEYKLTASHPSFALTAGNLVIPTDREVVISMLPGGILEGVVHKGGAVHEAPYMIGLGLDESTTGLEGSVPRLTVTDHEGKFRITNLEPGTWDVNVLKRVLDEDPLGLTNAMRLGPLMNQEVVIWSEETTTVEFNLGAKEKGPAAKVSGRVFVNGKPAEGALMSLWAKRRREAVVDSLGCYDLGEVSAGKRTVRVASLPGPTGEYDFSISRRVEVIENVPCEVSFEIFTGAISGRVRCDSNPGAMRAVRVSASLEGKNEEYRARMSTITGLDGTFFFEGVPAGIYVVRARESEFGCPPAKDVEVLAGSTASGVTLSMIPPVIVAGVVRLPEELVGKRWLGLYFETAGKESAESEWVSIKIQTGNFETRKLIPGSYSAKLYGDFEGSYKPFLFTVPSNGVDNLVFVPEKEEPEEPDAPGK
jgi:hypothetical protein